MTKKRGKADGHRRLADRRAIVTGAGTGIGRGIAEELAAQGADVALHYAHSADGACAAAEIARSNGVRADVFQADFDDVDAVRRLGARLRGYA